MRVKKSEPVLLRKLDISAAGKNTKLYTGDLTGNGKKDLLLVQPDGGIDDRYIPHQVQAMTAYDVNGNLLWQVGTLEDHPGGPGSDYPIQIYDIDGDGKNEVICVMEKQFYVLEGGTGKVKRKFSLPSEDAHDCIIIANLAGNAFPQDIILKNRYEQMWALDYDFNLLWTHKGNIGHYPWVFDFNRDGKDEVMAGYDFLNSNGELIWTCNELDDHADCIWVGKVMPNTDEYQIVIGGSVTVLYDWHGKEIWRYNGSIESQHVSIGKFHKELPGLQIAGLDRIVRGTHYDDGKDGIFLLDAYGQEIAKENRQSSGWLTIIETLRKWDASDKDYILAYRRGGGVLPTIYDGHLNEIITFPVDGYVVHADLTGSGLTQVIVYKENELFIYSSEYIDLNHYANITKQDKRLYAVTLYPGGEYR